MEYTILSENPTRFEIEGSVACEDCGEPTSILTDTIAGYLCDGCAKRFHDAAAKLSRYAIKHEAKQVLAMLPSRPGAA